MKIISLINFISQVLLVFYNYILIKLLTYHFCSLLFIFIVYIIMSCKISLNKSAIAIQHDILQPILFSTENVMLSYYQFMLFIFFILWFWYGLLAMITTLIISSRYKKRRKDSIIKLLAYAKKNSITKFKQIYNISVSVAKKRSIILTRLFQIYIIISPCLIVVLVMLYRRDNVFLDDMSFFLFIYNLIPLIIIISCLLDYARNKKKYIEYGFLSKKLRLAIYCHLHSILGTIILSTCASSVFVLSKFISLSNILSFFVCFFLLITIQILIINIVLLLASITLNTVRKILY